MLTAWMASKRVARSATCQPTSSAFPCSMTPNSQTLPSCTVAIWVASVARITFGALVIICRSCGASLRVRARCGDNRAFSRITRLRATRMPSITRSRAQTLRWPSPVHGERERSARIAASRASSATMGSARAAVAGSPAQRFLPAAGGPQRRTSEASPRPGGHGRHRSAGRRSGRSPTIATAAPPPSSLANCRSGIGTSTSATRPSPTPCSTAWCTPRTASS